MYCCIWKFLRSTSGPSVQDLQAKPTNVLLYLEVPEVNKWPISSGSSGKANKCTAVSGSSWGQQVAHQFRIYRQSQQMYCCIWKFLRLTSGPSVQDLQAKPTNVWKFLRLTSGPSVQDLVAKPTNVLLYLEVPEVDKWPISSGSSGKANKYTAVSGSSWGWQVAHQFRI